MRFVYKAKKGLHDLVKGMVEAQSREEALSRLVADGLFPISIEADLSQSITEEAKKNKKKREKTNRKKITPRQVLVFTQKLATLIRSRVPLLYALGIIYEQTDNILFQEAILDIYNATKEGKTFSGALSRYPALFSPLYINIIKSGEKSGVLDIALKQIMEFLLKEQSLRMKVRLALAYPSLLLSVGIGTVFILLTFVIPKLKPLLESSKVKLPFITQVILKISVVSRQSWGVVIATIALIILIIYWQKGNAFFKNLSRSVKMKLPVVKSIMINQELAHFSISLSMLLKRGVTALTALEVVIPGLEDVKLKNELKEVLLRVASGQNLSISMIAVTSLPQFFTKMIAVGEESGRLSEVLEEISSTYTQEVDSQVALLSSLIEPVLILVMGIILGSIVLAILVPTFQMTQILE